MIGHSVSGLRIPKAQERPMDIKKILETPQSILDLGDIDDSPGPYCMSFGFDLEPLIKSIQNVGMINSPLLILIENQGGAHTVIAGYRRIRALKALDYERTPCRLLSESQLSTLECLLLNLYDNLATRRLNEVERGMVLSRLESLVSQEEILDCYMPLLALPSHKETLHFYLRLERELEEEPKHYLAQGHMSLQVARMLLEIGQGARSRVFDLISRLKLNINQQKQLIDYIVDLAHINKISISDFLEEKPFEDILQKEDMNKPQKAKTLLHFLRALRFPTLVRAEEDFRKNVAGLGLPEGVRISAPPYFESPHYRLEILFEDGKELGEKLKDLLKKEGLEGLGNPWEEGG